MSKSCPPDPNKPQPPRVQYDAPGFIEFAVEVEPVFIPQIAKNLRIAESEVKPQHQHSLTTATRVAWATAKMWPNGREGLIKARALRDYRQKLANYRADMAEYEARADYQADEAEEAFPEKQRPQKTARAGCDDVPVRNGRGPPRPPVPAKVLRRKKVKRDAVVASDPDEEAPPKRPRAATKRPRSPGKSSATARPAKKPRLRKDRPKSPAVKKQPPRPKPPAKKQPRRSKAPGKKQPRRPKASAKKQPRRRKPSGKAPPVDIQRLPARQKLARIRAEYKPNKDKDACRKAKAGDEMAAGSFMIKLKTLRACAKTLIRHFGDKYNCSDGVVIRALNPLKLGGTVHGMSFKFVLNAGEHIRDFLKRRNLNYGIKRPLRASDFKTLHDYPNFMRYKFTGSMTPGNLYPGDRVRKASDYVWSEQRVMCMIRRSKATGKRPKSAKEGWVKPQKYTWN